MIIKLVEVRDTKKKGYDFKTIVGEKADGSEYQKDILIVKYKDLVRQLDDFGTGEFIELFYDMEDRYKPIINIKPAEGFPESNYNKPTANRDNVRRSDGTSRGDDTNRSAGIYLARNVMEQLYPPEHFYGQDEDQYLAELMSIANKIKNYISTGAVVTYYEQDGDDVLDPPKVD